MANCSLSPCFIIISKFEDYKIITVYKWEKFNFLVKIILLLVVADTGST